MSGAFVVINKFRSFDRMFYAHIRRSLRTASDSLAGSIQDNIDTPGYNNVPTPPGVVVVGRRPRTINHRHSKPGQFPFEQTGELHDSISVQILRSVIRSRVGSNDPKTLALELGLPAINLAPRPFLWRTLVIEQNRLGDLLLTPL